jgi:hypothetical protein
MEAKHLLSLIVLITVCPLLILLACMSHRLREWAFIAMVAGGVMVIDVNFLGEYWYRGTARGIEISLVDLLAWAILISTIVAPRYPGRRWIPPAGLGFMLLYFCYCSFSIAIAEEKMFGVWELAKVLRGIIILIAAAAFVRTRRELGILVFALGCSVCIETMFAFKQRVLSGMYRVAGTLDHANSLSMYMCVAGPVLLAASLSEWSKPLRWFAALCAALAGIDVLLTLSRAGLPIYALVMTGAALSCTSLEVTRRKLLIGFGVVACTGLLLLKSWDLIVARYESASLTEEYLDENAEGRGVYWRWAFAIVKDHPMGVGINNWSYAVSKTYGPRLGYWYEDYDDIKVSPEKAELPSHRYAAPAHSLAALTLGELGYPGLILFGFVWLRWFQMGAAFLRRRLNPDPMHRLAIGFLFSAGGMFLQSITEWTYRQQTNMFIFHILMGALASLHFNRKHPLEEEQEEIFDDEEEIDIEATPVQTPVGRAAI